KKMVASLLALTPLTNGEQKTYLRDTVAFDDRLRRKVKSQVEAADYVKLFNPMSVDEAAECLKPLDLKGLLRDVWGDAAPGTINVGTPDFVRGFGEILSDETFESFIRWTYVNTLLGYAPALSRTIAGLANAYRRRLTGVKEEPAAEKQAFRLASALYDQPVGHYYGRAYFGEAAKEDVVGLVRQIIAAYRTRIADNDFLSPATKEKAILKLDEIKIKMGYPDSCDAYYDSLKVREEDAFFDAMRAILCARIRRRIDKLTRPTDFTEWNMPGHMVNASYDPFKNDITFPAAILQKPFYSLTQKREENLGGIGTVIGHEISHAFDNNGAHFDEHGNLHDWWTEEDFKQFEARTQGMIEQYDGIPFHGGKVNGKLVVSENIADNGGMAATLEIMRDLPDAYYKAYFENFARVWCQKASESYIRLLLTNDVHSPAELRANMTPRNFAEWYAAFDVAPTDGMYIPEDKRVAIW
ncbi:MAG: M13 family metallopeptidase, partial [Clostridia bacterium]|nr:M13 family metallopeptidase [Clostridia bacterium]